MVNEKVAHGWQSALLQVGLFVGAIVVAFAVAVPLANASVRRRVSEN